MFWNNVWDSVIKSRSHSFILTNNNRASTWMLKEAMWKQSGCYTNILEINVQHSWMSFCTNFTSQTFLTVLTHVTLSHTAKKIIIRPQLCVAGRQWRNRCLYKKTSNRVAQALQVYLSETKTLKGVVHPQNDFLSIDYSWLRHLSSMEFFCICVVETT